MTTYENSGDPITRLQSKEHFGSRAIQRLARFAVEQREGIHAMTIAEFAQAAGASQSTVVRLCKELGYKGYRDFRIAMAERRGHQRGANLLGVDLSNDAELRTDISAIARQVIRINADILSATLDLLDFADIEKAIDLLLTSTHIHVVGFGSSAAVALDICQRFFRLGLPSSVHSDPHVVATVSANARRGSLFFGISYTGTTRDLVECLETVRSRNLRSISLSSFAVSPVSRAADVALISALRSPNIPAEAISARISQMAIIDVLFVGLALRHPWKPELVEAMERELLKKRM